MQVFVTSCPRAEPYIHRTLQSLSEAGFSEPTIIYDHALSGSCKTFNRALAVALASRGVFQDDWVIVVQDDVVVAKNLKEHLLKGVLYQCSPPRNKCVVSLYCADKSDTGIHGVRQYDLADPEKAYGALAICITVSAAEAYLKNPASRRSLSQTDYNLARFCASEGVPYWVCEPSLVQHIGATSSFVDGDGVPVLMNSLTPWRVAGRFCEDASEWVKRSRQSLSTGNVLTTLEGSLKTSLC